jgi:hypothetical protein
MPWHRDERIGMPRPLNPLCFIANDRIAVTFMTRSEAEVLPRRDQVDEKLPYRLHALFIDTATGKVRATRDWPTASDRAGVTPGTAGKFVAVTPDRLALYSSDLHLLKAIDLFLSCRAREGYWLISPSPNGRTMLIMNGAGNFQYNFRWFDIDDLRLLASWTESDRENVWKGTEDLVVRGGHFGSVYDDEMGGDFARGFLIRKLDAPWRFVSLKKPAFRSFGLVSPDVLLGLSYAREFGGPRQKMILVRTNGEVFFEQEFPEREEVSGRALSADGRRFAATFSKFKGGSAFLDIAARIVLKSVLVFDLKGCKWIYKVDAKEQRLKVVSALALSPDGSLLALINQDGVLEAYRLPETPTVPGQSAAKETQSAPDH